MSLTPRILGRPGADNALLVTVDSGDAVSHLLFDCGEGVLDDVRISQLQGIEHLCFSHFHLDHVSGFDSFFRHNYNRPAAPVRVWGPPGTIEAMHHRFRSYMWNLHHDQPGEWIVNEIDNISIQGARFHLAEAFETAHPLPNRPSENTPIFEGDHYRIEALLVPHGSICSVAYRIVEPNRKNICPKALRESGLAPGPWLRELTANRTLESIRVEDRVLNLSEVRADLVVETPGESLAYVTDFRTEKGSVENQTLLNFLSGTTTLVSECQYRNEDRSLALANGHMTAGEVGKLASEAGLKRVILQHLSRRYRSEDWPWLLREVKTEFQAAAFPDDWSVEP